MKSGLWKKCLLLVALLVPVAACSSPKPIDAWQFRELLDARPVDSAESWWVLRESERYYYLAQEYVWRRQEYRVPKKHVTIDVAALPTLDGRDNLKRRHVYFEALDAPMLQEMTVVGYLFGYPWVESYWERYELP